MKQNYFIIIVLSLFILSCSTNKVFNKLDKKYKQSNFDKVLQKADRYVKKNPANPIPLYFKSLTYLHLYNENKKPDNLEKALKYLYLASRKKIPDYLENDLNLHKNNLLTITQKEVATIENTTDPLTAQNILSYHKRIHKLPNIKVAKGKITEPKKTEPENTNKLSNGIRKTIVTNAQKYIGTPYKYGGTTTQGFDCSGYTGYVYLESGINLPRTTKQQALQGNRVTEKKAKPGDLLFFKNTTGHKEITHVALILEVDNKGIKSIIHATSKGVIINNRTESAWTSYWKSKIHSIATYIR